MKKSFARTVLASILLVYCGFIFLSSTSTEQKDLTRFTKPDPSIKPLTRSAFYFIENKGQLDPHVQYHIKMSKGNVFYTKEHIDYQFLLKNKEEQPDDNKTISLENIRLHFLMPNQDVKIFGTQQSDAKFNFYQGNQPDNWISQARSFHKILYQEIWPHVDMVVYNSNGKIKHEYIVKPGGNINEIGFKYEGIEKIFVNQQGELEIKTRSRTLKEDTPVSYQMIDNKKIMVPTQYKLDEDKITFQVQPYNQEVELIIDPALLYSTFLGGSRSDMGADIAIDLHLNAYVVGHTSSSDFPTTPGAYDKVLNNKDAFLSKLDSTGSNLLFSTYFGGSETEYGSSIIFSWGDDSPVIAGQTYSSDLPTHAGAFDRNLNGSSDVFVAKFTSSGTFKYCTYLGGGNHETAPEIGIDGTGNIFIGGSTESSDFVTTPGVIDDQFDPNSYGNHQNIFISKFNSMLSTVQYSTFLGKEDMDFHDITADFNGNAYVVGGSYGLSYNKIPTTPGAYVETHTGWGEGFITKIDPTGENLVFSTYMGNGIAFEDEQHPTGVDVDGSGNVYVASIYRNDSGPWYSAYVKKYSADGSAKLFDKSLYYSAGLGMAFASDIAVDGRGGAYILGTTDAEDFSVTTDAFQSNLAGGWDLFIVKVNSLTGNTIYSTFFGGIQDESSGGIAADSFESVYITGKTESPDFPTTPNVFSQHHKGCSDAIVARIRDSGPTGKLKLNKDTLKFTVPYQSTDSRSKGITVKNTGKGVVNYNIYTDQKWLSIKPTSGDVRKETDSVNVFVTPGKKLKAGTHIGTVKVTSIDAYNSPQNLVVKMKVKGPAVKVKKKKFDIEAKEGGEDPDPLVLKIRNKGPGKLRYRIISKDSWLSTNRKQGVSTGEWDSIKIFIDIKGKSPGSYEGTIEITNKDSVDEAVVIEVTLSITS